MNPDEALLMLESLGVHRVDHLRRKLDENASDAERVGDLWSEGIAAALFARAEFAVEMSDSPDLWLTRGGQLASKTWMSVPP
jgi:hypothetical protein